MKTIFLIIALLVGTQSLASDGFIQADNERGQGQFRARKGECYMITARHVVADASDSSDKNVVLEDKSDFSFRVAERYEDDVAVLHLIGKIPQCFDKEWSDGSNLNSILKTKSRDSEIRFIDENGSFIRIAVEIVGGDATKMIRVKPKNPNEIIAKGYSGSPIYNGDHIIGMLIEVENGIGIAYRQDYLNNLLSTFFQKSDISIDHNKNQTIKPINPNYSSIIYYTLRESELKKTPNRYGAAITAVPPGVRITVIDNSRIDSWLYVREEESGYIGYLHNNQLEERKQ